MKKKKKLKLTKILVLKELKIRLKELYNNPFPTRQMLYLTGGKYFIQATNVSYHNSSYSDLVSMPIELSA